MDAPVSPPLAPKNIPAARPAALPPRAPVGRSRVPWVVRPVARPRTGSGRLVSPISTAPAAFRRVTVVASRGNEVGVHGRRARRFDAFSVVGILHRHRDAVQRSAVATRRDIPLYGAGGFERFVTCQGNERTNPGLYVVDACENRLCKLDRRQPFRSDLCSGLCKRPGSAALRRHLLRACSRVRGRPA